MLRIRAYPRDRWPLGLGIITAVLSLGIIFGYGIPCINRAVDVTAAQETAANVADANHFWRMVAGVDPIDSSDLGRVAATTRRVGDKPNPIRAFLTYYVAPGELPDLDKRLGFHAFDRPHPDNSRETKSDQGRFTDRFILHAIQALKLVPESSVNDLIRPIPDVPSYGWLRWQWAIAGLVGFLVVCGLFGLWLRRDRRHWPARAKARAIATLSTEESQVYRIITGLEREPVSEARDEMLTQAKALFRDMQRGMNTRGRLDELRKALDDATETWQVKRQVYEELSGIADPDKSS